MKIVINNKLSPFSHTPGVLFLIPGTTWALRSYPSKLAFMNLESSDTCHIDLDVLGPVKNFTCTQDLDKGKVYVYGTEKRGYFRFEIYAVNDGLEIILDSCFNEGFLAKINNKLSKHIYCKDRLSLDVEISNVRCFSKDVESLSLGINKKPDWDLILRRKDIREIFPIWLKLGIFLPDKTPPKEHPIISEIEKKIKNKEKQTIHESFLNLFSTNFNGVLCPMRVPQNHLGIIDEIPFSFSPFILLQKSAKYIRQLFFEQNDRCMHILPCLPSLLHSGRYINIQCNEVGVLGIEWSKKLVKKIKIHSIANNKIRFDLQKKITSFRVRETLQDKGKRYKRNDEILLECGKTYFIDRFEK